MIKFSKNAKLNNALCGIYGQLKEFDTDTETGKARAKLSVIITILRIAAKKTTTSRNMAICYVIIATYTNFMRIAYIKQRRNCQRLKSGTYTCVKSAMSLETIL